MRGPKIQFSPAEEELMSDASVILTKNRVLEKIRNLLEGVQEQQVEYVHSRGLQDHALFRVSPKISRGENYLGLPWLILDYPRVFRPEGICAIRSMFWWGRFFSSTLHLSGSSVARTGKTLWEARALLAAQAYYRGVHSDPWRHYFETDNYRSIDGREPAEAFTQAPHLKIAAQWPVSQWPIAGEKLFESWKRLLEIGLIA